jgi:hypothetical protein
MTVNGFIRANCEESLQIAPKRLISDYLTLLRAPCTVDCTLCMHGGATSVGAVACLIGTMSQGITTEWYTVCDDAIDNQQHYPRCNCM